MYNRISVFVDERKILSLSYLQRGKIRMLLRQLNEGSIFTYNLSKMSFCIATTFIFIYNWYLVY